jgi:excisionase family DNA binding protein
MRKPAMIRERIARWRMMSVAEAAEELGLSVRRVRDLCRQSRLGHQVGRAYVITAEELREFKKKPRRPGRPRESKPRKEK